MQRCNRILNSNCAFGIKVGLPLHRYHRSEEGTAQKSGFQLHDVCDGPKRNTPRNRCPAGRTLSTALYFYTNVYGATFALGVLGEVDGEEAARSRPGHRAA